MKTNDKTDLGHQLGSNELQSINGGGIVDALITEWVLFLIEHRDAYVEGVKDAAKEMYTTIYE